MDYSGWDPGTSVITFELLAVVSISCKKQELLLLRRVWKKKHTSPTADTQTLLPSQSLRYYREIP